MSVLDRGKQEEVALAQGGSGPPEGPLLDRALAVHEKVVGDAAAMHDRREQENLGRLRDSFASSIARTDFGFTLPDRYEDLEWEQDGIPFRYVDASDADRASEREGLEVGRPCDRCDRIVWRAVIQNMNALLIVGALYAAETLAYVDHYCVTEEEGRRQTEELLPSPSLELTSAEEDLVRALRGVLASEIQAREE